MLVRIRKTGRGKDILVAVILFVMAVVLIGGSMSSSAKGRGERGESYKYYTSVVIEQGDTLWGIASEYVTPEYSGVEEYIREVRALNHMEGDCIRAGQYLLVPYYSDEFHK